ncbi:MAG: hypothetical protein RRA35_09905 [Desulfomonilia bacterium]|nr:hypothetical protein [Desulfomonilia bacterium]
MRYWYQALKSALKPDVRFLSLTGRTVAVAAGTEQLNGLPARVTAAKNGPEGGSSAVHDRLNDVPVVSGDPRAELFEV